MVYFLHFSTVLLHLAFTFQVCFAQVGKTYIIAKNPDKIPHEDLAKLFDLDQIDWDFFRQTIRKTEVVLDIGVTLEILSVKELSEKGIFVDASKISKIQFSRKNHPDFFDSKIVLIADSTGEIRNKNTREIVTKTR